MAPVCDGGSPVTPAGDPRQAERATGGDVPYLSVVVTARNDDHGGNLLARMQTFVNALIGQSRRYQLRMELILVEWNPPADRPSLAEALRWPEDCGRCQVRIIEVPPEVHRRYPHADALPLYQMIAKNVGIRRARGRFILATNIDIVFSEELIGFLAQGRLESGKMYRLDRYDVMAGVPADGSPEEQLEYCRSHLLRLNAREGTFQLTPEGARALFDDDIATPGSGIWLGRGWYPPEQHAGRVFRWVGQGAEFTLHPPHPEARVAKFHLEPGPGAGRQAIGLRVLEADGRVVGEAQLRGRSVLRLHLSSPERATFRFVLTGGGRKAPHDPRSLNFRVLRCAWEQSRRRPAATSMRVRPERLRRLVRLPAAAWQLGLRAGRFCWQLRRGAAGARIGVPFPTAWLARLAPRLAGGGLSLAVTRRLGEPRPAAPAHLHTTACGDFTLLARENWFDLRGYPELELFSMNLDSVFCYAAHHGGAPEEVLEDPLRIYHIEHAAGSGWTPEGQTHLFERMARQNVPWLDYHELMDWARVMQGFQAPMIFNRGNWGLADLDLRETLVRPGRPSSRVQTGRTPREP